MFVYSYIERLGFTIQLITPWSVLSYSETKSQRSDPSGYFIPIALQLTPAGIRYGKAFGVFVEVGYGYKGVVNAGFSGRF